MMRDRVLLNVDTRMVRLAYPSRDHDLRLVPYDSGEQHIMYPLLAIHVVRSQSTV